MYADRHTYTRVLQYSHASVGLAQACPNYSNSQTYPLGVNTKVDRVACWGKSEFGGKGEGGGQCIFPPTKMKKYRTCDNDN